MLIEVLTTIVGVAMSLAYFPQAYEIWKHKSAEDVSIPSYIVFAIGTFVWLLYGIYLKSLVIILSFAAGVIGSWLVLTLSLIYQNKKKK